MEAYFAIQNSKSSPFNDYNTYIIKVIDMQVNNPELELEIRTIIKLKVINILRSAYYHAKAISSSINPESDIQKLQIFHWDISGFIDKVPWNTINCYLTKDKLYSPYLDSLFNNAFQAIRSLRIEWFKLLREKFIITLKESLRQEIKNTYRDINKSIKDDQPLTQSKYATLTIECIFDQLNVGKLQKLRRTKEGEENKSEDLLFDTYIKDLLIVYFVISLKAISYIFNQEKMKITTSGAYQLAFDLDYMLKAIYESEIISSDPVYQDKLKQLKEISRWKRYIRLFLTGSNNSSKDNKVLENEIGDLQYLKRSVIKLSTPNFNVLHKSLTMFEL